MLLKQFPDSYKSKRTSCKVMWERLKGEERRLASVVRKERDDDARASN